MARFKLKYGTNERDFGAAIASAAVAYAGGGMTATSEQAVTTLIDKQPGESFALHYDGQKGGQGKYVIHIVVPDVSDMMKDGSLDLTNFANEALADYLERGCAN